MRRKKGDKPKRPDKSIVVIDSAGRRQRKAYDSEFTGGISKYRPEFNDDLIEHLSQGYSFMSFAGKIYRKYSVKVSTETLYQWTYTHPDFALAKSLGESLGLRFHETLLRCVETGYIPNELKVQGIKKLNLRAIIFILSTRYFKIYPLYNQAKVTEQVESTEITINIDSEEAAL